MNVFFLLLIVVLQAVGNTQKGFPFFLQSTTPGYSPCSNFYQFACNKWLEKNTKPKWEPSWNPWVAASHEINQNLKEILETHSNADFALNQAKRFYQTCVKSYESNEYLEELSSLLESFGGWPLIHPYWQRSTFDWLEQIASITRLLAIHPIIKFKIDIDYTNPKKYMLYIEPGDLIFPHDILLQATKYGPELDAYEKWIYKTIRILNHYETDDGRIKTEINALIKFEMRLAELHSINKLKNVRLSIDKLARKVPQYNWKTCFNAFFKDLHRFTPNETITIRNYGYFRNLFKLVRQTDLRTIANYLSWSIVKDLSRDVTSSLRDLNFRINSAVLGIKTDYPRDFECVSKTIEYFAPILAPIYFESRFESAPMVDTMIIAIKKQLIDRINRNRLIGSEAKRLIMEKIEHVDAFVAFPKWYLDYNRTERFYVLSMSDNHFLNVFLMKNFKMVDDLKRLTTGNVQTEWPASPFDVNAYYSILQNAIFIPLGLLQKPFFHPNQSNIKNYAAIGSLIGHELAHSIDPVGLLANKNGKVTNWLPFNDVQVLKNATHCYKSSHDIGEKMADEIGVEISLKTLDTSSKNDIGDFFTNFAQIWCEIGKDLEIFGDEHAPNIDRVEFLTKNHHFIDAFRCTNNKNNEQCTIW